MKRIIYETQFTSVVDNLSGDQRLLGIGPSDTISESYDAWEELDQILTDTTEDWLSMINSTSLEQRIDQDLSCNNAFHDIESDCGDDEVITTNCQSYGPLRVIAGPIISGVKLSYKDSGVSNQLFNYTEGWIITPPTRESCFEAVNRRHQRDGIPFVLDGVKLKLISAVRKQSKMELDLESKIGKVFENASWINRYQFTYDYHQMMKILGLSIFDYRDSRSFPFLFESEGGCGGLPPYGNLDTVYGGMHLFHKGKAKGTILGLMHETVEVHHGRLAPNETFFLRSSHISQLGDKAWIEYDSVYREILKGKTPTEAKNLLNVLADKTSLPAELLEKGAEISPDNVIVGTAIAQLRDDKFLMTELDIKLQLENRKKILALGGDIPFSQILKEVEEEKNSFKANSWKVLGTIAKYLGSTTDGARSVLASIPNGETDYQSVRMCIRDYFMLRTEHYASFTSFCYTDAIRVFKTSDVVDYISTSGNVLRDNIVKQLSPTLKMAGSVDIVQERLRKEEIFSWLNQAELNELLRNPLPPGVGPDDGRIMREIFSDIEAHTAEELETCPRLYLLLSGDRALGRGIVNHLHVRHRDKKWLVLQIDQSQYIGLCLNNIAGLRPVETTSRSIVIWNYITNSAMNLPIGAQIQIKQEVNKMNASHYTPLVLYDYPNLERAIEPSTFDANSRSVVQYTGGYLRRNTLKYMTESKSFGASTLDEIYSMADLSYGLHIKHPIANIRFDDKTRWVNNPRKLDYNAIAVWTQSQSVDLSIYSSTTS